MFLSTNGIFVSAPVMKCQHWVINLKLIFYKTIIQSNLASFWHRRARKNFWLRPFVFFNDTDVHFSNSFQSRMIASDTNGILAFICRNAGDRTPFEAEINFKNPSRSCLNEKKFLRKRREWMNERMDGWMNKRERNERGHGWIIFILFPQANSPVHRLFVHRGQRRVNKRLSSAGKGNMSLIVLRSRKLKKI